MDDTARQRILTESELSALRGACRTPREALIHEFLRSTGCREFEMLNVLVEDLNFEANIVHLRKTKGKVHWHGSGEGRSYETRIEPRDSIIDEACVSAIKIYLSTLDLKPKSRLVPLSSRAIRYFVGRLALRARIDRPSEVHPHTYRHTCATRMLADGVPEPYILQVLGWSPGTKTFREVYNKAPIDIVARIILKRPKNGEKDYQGQTPQGPIT